jgi:hypothetical protein
MYNKNLICVFLLNIILLSGCATVTHVSLSKQNNQLIKTVYINPEIKKPEQMYEFASGSQLGAAFGLVGGVVAALANESAAISTQKFAEKNQIDIRKIVYERWMSEVAGKSKFKLVKQPGDAVLTTDIVVYGISIPHGFSTDYVPMLTLNAKLVRNNKIIWQDSERVLPLTGGLPRYKMDQIMNDPKKLYAMWDKASEKIINEMLVDMDK